MTENPFIRSASILTEHLGYVPIALVDDVINAANEILYKCTAALDQFLAGRYPTGHLRVEPGDRARLLKRRRLDGGGASRSPSHDARFPAGDGRDALDDEENGEIDIAAEMELGTAKFETLFESIVDKCFDKYELYLLRNLLVIPGELVEGGWIRLAHHRGLDFTLPSLFQTQHTIKPRTSRTRGATTVEIEDAQPVENIPEPSPGLKAAKGAQSPASSSPEPPSKDTSSDSALAATTSADTTLDSSEPLVENDSDALYSQIADLQRQIAFEHTLSRLIAAQSARTSALISDVLEPTESQCRDVMEFRASLEMEGSANTRVGRGDGGDEGGLSTEEVATAYREILPLEDTIAFLGERVRALLADTARAQALLHESSSGSRKEQDNEDDGEMVSSPPAPFSVNRSLSKYEATLFIDTFVRKAVQETGLSK